MNNFGYSRVLGVGDALTQIRSADGSSHDVGAAFIAGGTNLIDLMKEHVATPSWLVDINHLPLNGIAATGSGGLRLGALARNAATARHPLVERHAPLVGMAILAGASAQIRNMASNGGNLLQRTRCVYFYDNAVPCNKRLPGSGCPATTGLARQHAILGASPHCVATHPSDLCVALAALGASVEVQSASRSRSIPFADFHRLPGDEPERDTTLAPDELITHIDLPNVDRFAGHSAYLKIRDRASYAFALVSVAAALDLAADGTLREARIAVGGVAHKPWRLPAAEALLAGQKPGADLFGRCADALLDGAQATGHGEGSNAFKIELARNAIVRALEMALRGTASNRIDELNDEEVVA